MSNSIVLKSTDPKTKKPRGTEVKFCWLDDFAFIKNNKDFYKKCYKKYWSKILNKD